MWTKEKMVKWYDDYATDENVPDDQIVSVKASWYKIVASKIDSYVQLMHLTKDDKVLDAGCGAS